MPESFERYARLLAERMSVVAPSPDEAAPEHAAITPATATVSVVMAAYLRFARGYNVKGDKPTGELGNIQYALTPLRKLYGARWPATSGH